MTFDDDVKWMIRIRQHVTFGFGSIAPGVRMATMESEMETMRVLKVAGLAVPEVCGGPIRKYSHNRSL